MKKWNARKKKARNFRSPGRAGSTTMKSAIHLRLEFCQNLIACQNTNFESLINTADCGQFIRISEFTFHDVWLLSAPCAMIKQSDGPKQTYMSVLIHSHAWENKSNNRSKRQVDRTHLRRIVLNWCRTNRALVQYCPGFTSIDILRRIQKDLNARRLSPVQFEGTIIEWTKNGNFSECILERWKVAWNVRLQARWEMGPASRSNDWIIRTERSSRIPRCKCAQPRNLEVKIRKKHYSLHTGLKKHWVNNAHHSANQLSVFGAVSSWCIDLSGSHAMSGIHWSEYVHSRRKWTLVTTAGSARTWFFGKKLAQDTRSCGKLLAWTLTKVRNDDSRRATSHWKRRSKIHQDSPWRNVVQKWWGREW